MENKRVIIVDDSHFIVKQLVKFYREEMEWEIVATGENGQEALDLYRKFKPDLISLDIVMAPINGLEAVENIISEFPDANIIMASAVRTGEMLDCITYGAKGYIEKPLRMREQTFIQDFKDTLTEIFDD